MLVIDKVPLEVIPRYPPKGLSTYRVLRSSAIPIQSHPTFSTRSSAFIILLVPSYRGIVVGVVGVVNIEINFLSIRND